VVGDISEIGTAQKVVEQAVHQFGRIDTLINNAGIFIAKPLTDYTVNDYLAMTGANLTGFFHITPRVIRHMLTQAMATSSTSPPASSTGRIAADQPP
jgi:NADP-dependent 3-hydroxy acid dehydrogenase YdfG